MMCPRTPSPFSPCLELGSTSECDALCSRLSGASVRLRPLRDVGHDATPRHC